MKICKALQDGTFAPYSFGELKADHPHTSFPRSWLDGTNTVGLADYGVYPYVVQDDPVFDPYTETVVDGDLIESSGSIIQQRIIVPLSGDELVAAQEVKRQVDKLAGVEFEGIMCSATAEDMWGLSAIREWIVSGQTANFKFENGNTLAITPENYAAFQAVWIPFRASFF